MKRSVLRQLHKTDDSLSVPAVGKDFVALPLENGEFVTVSTQTRCLGTSVIRGLSVYAALNNLYCSGARPLGILVNLLLTTACTENDLRDEMAGIHEICAREQIPVLGGHTEVTRSVTEPVLTVTALGAAEATVRSGQVQPGMDLVMTKWAALEGTAILAIQRNQELLSRFAQPFLDRGKEFVQYLSVRSEAAVAAKSGAAVMHDVSEGGIFGALWEMGQRGGVGLEIDLKKIPVRQETIEICEFFDLNPYKLVSGGSLLIATEDGNALVRTLEQEGIPSVVIGKATDSNDRVLINGEERRFLETTQTDELWKLGNCSGVAQNTCCFERMKMM